MPILTKELTPVIGHSFI